MGTGVRRMRHTISRGIKNSVVKIKAGAEEGTFQSEDHGFSLDILISKCEGLGTIAQRSLALNFEQCLIFSDSTEGGQDIGDPRAADFNIMS